MAVPYTVELLEKLRKNAHLNKHSHFEASKRYGLCHVITGIPLIVINIALGSVYLTELTVDDKQLGVIMALIAFLGASLSAIQTFFNFQKTFESHRAIANQYLAIARECDIAIATYCDNPDTDLEKLKFSLEKFNLSYLKVNKDAEALPTSDKDYKKSLGIQRGKENNEEQSILDSYLMRKNAEVV